MAESAAPGERIDVLVIGGAFSGASVALLLRRWLPAARILVVERAPAFDRKVGEATVEVSALFLTRVLGLFDFLARHQLPKHGLRFWFADGPERTLAEMTEIGPDEVPRLPSYQLDRSVLDEHLLATARAEGVEVARPAKVAAVELGWPESRVEIEAEDGARRSVAARWVVDASGRHAFLARRLRLHRRTEEHPTAALWGRWTGVADLDGPAVLGADPRRPRLPAVTPSRRLATNHFCGYGWWCWFIPLRGGETSVGVVYNKELVELPGADPAERYRRFLESRPGIRELLAGARLDQDDFRSYSHLPYRAERYAGKGWALVGDAASFIDPYYSPGLDHASISAFATARMIEDELAGRLEAAAAGAGAGDPLEAAVARHNQVFERSYGRWLHALYVGKYELFGDAELTAAAYLVETALYYMGIVTTKDRDLEHLRYPPYGEGLWQETLFFRLMRGFTRRLTRLARRRRALGIYGRRNAGWRLLGRAPGLGAGALHMLRSGLRIYLRVERETFLAGLRPAARRPAPEPESHRTPASLSRP
ncbi:MAG TPA: tryptophan 7-halogenase [Thermoanaerobaculia bacterium]|nr:tryptophan 7-halogenase [Thermoanaerobaculia bacterium]